MPDATPNGGSNITPKELQRSIDQVTTVIASVNTELALTRQAQETLTKELQETRTQTHQLETRMNTTDLALAQLAGRPVGVALNADQEIHLERMIAWWQTDENAVRRVLDWWLARSALYRQLPAMMLGATCTLIVTITAAVMIHVLYH